MQRFSTSGLPSPRAKIDYLKQVLSSVFTDLDVEPDAPGEFDNHIRSTGLGGLSIAHAVSAPARSRDPGNHGGKLEAPPPGRPVTIRSQDIARDNPAGGCGINFLRRRHLTH